MTSLAVENPSTDAVEIDDLAQEVRLGIALGMDPCGLVSALLSSRVDNDTLDEVVKVIIASALDGTVADDQARQAILVAVFHQHIHEQAVDQYGVPPHYRDEIVGAVYEKIAAKILDPTGAGFDLARAASSSACAWTRRTAHFAAQQKVRDCRRATNRNGTPVDPTTGGLAAISTVTYDPDPNSEPAVLDRSHQAIEGFAARSQTVRGMSRIREVANRTYRLYDIPKAIRPEDSIERQAIFEAFEADPRMAHRSLAAFGRIVTGEEPTASDASIDSAMLMLWDDFSLDMVERLLDTDPGFAYVVAIDAVAPWTRPSKRAVQKFRSEMSKAKAGDHIWRSLVAGLAASFVDHEFHYISDYTVIEETERQRQYQGSLISRSKFEPLLRRAASYPDAPLGSTVAEVRQSLLDYAVPHLASSDLCRHVEQEAAA